MLAPKTTIEASTFFRFSVFSEVSFVFVDLVDDVDDDGDAEVFEMEPIVVLDNEVSAG